MNIKEIYQRVLESKFGVFVSEGNMSLFITPKDKKYFVFERKVVNENNSLLIALKIRNISEKPISLKSLVVADIFLEGSIHKVLEHKWLITTPPNIKNLDVKTEKKTVFLKREDNHFSFEEDYGYIKDSIVSEWFTKIYFDENTLLAGATTTAKYYSQVYIQPEPSPKIRLACQLDDTTLEPSETLEAEKFRIFVGSEDEVEKKFAVALKSDMSINKIVKPLRGIIMTYYFKYNFVDQKIFDDQIRALKRFNLDSYMNCVIIDAGYCKYWGDWLDTSGRFERGLANVVKKIRDIGCVPCIWIAPLVADPRSEMYKNHKEWFLKDSEIFMNVRFTSPIEQFVPNMGLKVVDSTNVAYLAYIKEVADEFANLGFGMFKLDFIYPVGFFNNFSKKITRVETLRSVIDIFKNSGQGKNLILSGLSQMSPLVGLVDYVRISSDIITPYARPFSVLGKLINRKMQKYSLDTALHRGFLNSFAWLNDFDCIVFIKKDPFNDRLVKRQVNLVMHSGASLWFGDDLTKLEPTHVAYLKKIFSEHKKKFGAVS